MVCNYVCRDNRKIPQKNPSKLFSYDFIITIYSEMWPKSGFWKDGYCAFTGKNDGFWLLWRIFKEYIKQNIITAVLIKANAHSANAHTYILPNKLEHVYMRPEVNSNRFEISDCFEMSFRLHGNLHGDFTALTFQTTARTYCICANDIF